MVKAKNPELEERRRLQVMETVQNLLAEGSHAKMTLDRVAAAAGVSKGLVTYYFRSKDELVLAAIRHYHDQQRALMASVVDSVDTPVEQLLPRLMHAAFLSRETVEHELRFQVEVWAFAKQNPNARDAVAESYRSFRAACEALMDRGVKEGWVTTQDRSWTALLLHALIDGLSFQLAVDPSLDVETLRQRISIVFTQLMRGAVDPASD